jgi:hypothetical protein
MRRIVRHVTSPAVPQYSHIIAQTVLLPGKTLLSEKCVF